MYGGGSGHTGRSSIVGDTSLPLLQQWKTDVALNVYSSPVVGSDNTVYAGSDGNYLYAMNGSTGALRWSYPTGSAVYSTAAIGADGTVYVGSYDKSLSALMARVAL